MKNENQSVDFLNAIEYLTNHPAFNSDIGWGLDYPFTWYTLMLCKNGHAKYVNEKIENLSIKVYKADGEEIFKKFWDKRDNPELDDNIETDDEYYIKYYLYYGYNWEYYETKFFGELTFLKYKQSSDKEAKRIPYLNWEAYHGVDADGDTFEEMVINLSNKAKEAFGNFKREDFYTPEEIKNHEDEEIFFFENYEDRNDLFKMIPNPKYNAVEDSTVNDRWWVWYKTTEHYKEHWDYSTNEN